MTFSANATEFRNDSIAACDGWRALECIDSQVRRSFIDPAPRPSNDDDGAEENLIGAILPHLPLLRNFLRRRVPVADLEDVIQDVLLSIVRRADTTAVTHPKSYLFQAAQAALVDRYRRQTTRRSSCHRELFESDHPVDDMSPLRILLARDDLRAVEDVLRQLPERTQQIFVAMRVEGSSLKALASRYNISTSAIEKHITRAAKALSDVRRSDFVAVHH